MELTQLIRTICDSDRSEWNFIGGETFHYSFTSVGMNPSHVEIGDCPYATASFMLDLDISILLGRTAIDDFQEKWANGFADPRASSKYADVYYRGSLVLRTTYVVVDGGRASLPMPKIPDMTCPVDYYKFVGLIDEMEGSEFDDYFNRAGIQTIETPWRPWR